MAAKTTRMIRTILLIAASCLAWLGAGAQQYEGAHLKFESSFHNFGSVPRWGGDLVWEFEYTNDGSAPLVIVRAQTTCSCLKVSHSKRPLAPGETAVIRVVYEPHKNEPGHFQQGDPDLFQFGFGAGADYRLRELSGYRMIRCRKGVRPGSDR